MQETRVKSFSTERCIPTECNFENHSVYYYNNEGPLPDSASLQARRRLWLSSGKNSKCPRLQNKPIIETKDKYKKND